MKLRKIMAGVAASALAVSSLAVATSAAGSNTYTIEKGIFADVKRPKNGGKGLDGVTLKGEHYLNPFVELMKGKH